MAPITPTGVPSQLTSGDSWRWRVPEFADYPQSEGWVLHYRILGKSVIVGGPADIVAVWQTSGVDIGNWLVSLATTVTDDLSAGRYRVIGRMVGSGTYAGREETVSDTVLNVLPDPRTAAAGAFQTHNERTLAIIELAIEGRLTADIESYQVGGRAVSKIPATELVSLRQKYAAAVNQERSGRFGRSVAMRIPSVVD